MLSVLWCEGELFELCFELLEFFGFWIAISDEGEGEGVYDGERGVFVEVMEVIIGEEGAKEALKEVIGEDVSNGLVCDGGDDLWLSGDIEEGVTDGIGADLLDEFLCEGGWDAECVGESVECVVLGGASVKVSEGDRGGHLEDFFPELEALEALSDKLSGLSQAVGALLEEALSARGALGAVDVEGGIGLACPRELVEEEIKLCALKEGFLTVGVCDEVEGVDDGFTLVDGEVLEEVITTDLASDLVPDTHDSKLTLIYGGQEDERPCGSSVGSIA